MKVVKHLPGGRLLCVLHPRDSHQRMMPSTPTSFRHSPDETMVELGGLLWCFVRVFFDPMTSFFLLKMAPQSGASFRAQAPSLVPMYTRIPSQTRKMVTHLGPVSGHECWATFPHKKRRRVTKKSNIPKHLFHHGMAESETLPSGLPGHYPQRQKKTCQKLAANNSPSNRISDIFCCGGSWRVARTEAADNHKTNSEQASPETLRRGLLHIGPFVRCID